MQTTVTIEQTIVEKISNGDQSAYEELFHTYYAHLCNFAFQFMKEQEASEEIVQDIFYNIWNSRQSLDIQVSIKSYLFSSVRNRCINQLKQIQTREKYKQYNEQQIAYSENVTHDLATENDLAALIVKSVEELPPERKKIFLLSREEGLKNKDIADKLNISIKTVENQMGKALKFLRTQLVDYLPFITILLTLFNKKSGIE